MTAAVAEDLGLIERLWLLPPAAGPVPRCDMSEEAAGGEPEPCPDLAVARFFWHSRCGHPGPSCYCAFHRDQALRSLERGDTFCRECHAPVALLRIEAIR